MGDLEFEGGEDADDFAGWDFDAQDAVDLRRGQFDGAQRLLAGVQVADDRDAGAAAQFRHQVGRPRCRFHRQLWVHPPPESGARFADQSQQAGGAADVEEVKVGRFQENVGRCLSDFAFQAAHHAGHGHGAAPVGDEQHLLVEGARDPVERLHLLAGAGAAHDDCWLVAAEPFGFPSTTLRASAQGRPGAQKVIVEGVQRLP